MARTFRTREDLETKGRKVGKTAARVAAEIVLREPQELEKAIESLAMELTILGTDLGCMTRASTDKDRLRQAKSLVDNAFLVAEAYFARRGEKK